MDFSNITDGILEGIQLWETRLVQLQVKTITMKCNKQNRTVKQILGHMVDAASNNLHRIIHLQYQETPYKYPNYATNGNNDRWIEIQNYREENWKDLIQYWKYLHIHLIHVIKNIKPEKLHNEWISDSIDGNISLENMVIDFLRHFNLHLSEIKELIEN